MREMVHLHVTLLISNANYHGFSYTHNFQV